MARMKRISAGVSNCGPSHATYTPSPTSSPSRSAAARARARSSGSYASLMSGKRGPSDVVVRPDERRRALQVDVIRDEDELPGPVVRVDPARGVRHDERADAERAEHPDAEDDAVGADALVQVRPAAHDGHRHASERAEHEHSRMPDGSGHRPARDLRVRDLDAVVELVGEAAETAPEDDAHPRL